jgi:hypothetical protein
VSRPTLQTKHRLRDDNTFTNPPEHGTSATSPRVASVVCCDSFKSTGEWPNFGTTLM